MSSSVPTDDHHILDSLTDRAGPYHDFLHFRILTSDHHVSPPPLPSINGDGSGEVLVGMRRQRPIEEEEDGAVKRARFADVNGNECLDFDLNISGFLDDDDDDDNDIAVEFESKGKEVICVDSDIGGGDVDVNVLNEVEFYANGEENAVQADTATVPKFGMIDVGFLCHGIISSSQRRYTREEKGKGILDDNWLSIAIQNHRMAYSEGEKNDVSGRGDTHTRSGVSWNEVFGVVNEKSEDCFVPDVDGIHIGEAEEFFIQEAITSSFLPQLNLEPPINHNELPATGLDNNALLHARTQANRRREERRRSKEIAKFYE